MIKKASITSQVSSVDRCGPSRYLHNLNSNLGLVSGKLPIRYSSARRRLTPLDQVLIALQFYATGTFQSVVGNVLKISQSSICRAIRDVSNALAFIAKDHINFNTNLLVVGGKTYIIVTSLL